MYTSKQTADKKENKFLSVVHLPLFSVHETELQSLITRNRSMYYHLHPSSTRGALEILQIRHSGLRVQMSGLYSTIVESCRKYNTQFFLAYIDLLDIFSNQIIWYSVFT